MTQEFLLAGPIEGCMVGSMKFGLLVLGSCRPWGYIGIMEGEMETTRLYRDNGKENGSYYSIFGVI